MARTPIRYREGSTGSAIVNPNVPVPKKKQKMFSITAADCEWQEFRGSGNGGQKKQKTSSGVRCTHEPSGAVGKATDSRSQGQNRATAFLRMTQTPEFRAWMELEIDVKIGNVRTEIKDNGVWVEGTPDRKE